MASFFVSRIDTLIDGKIDATLKNATTRCRSGCCCEALQGKVAIANAKLTYQSLQENLQRSALAGSGGARRANAARPLGQHRHEESGVQRRLYVEELIGPDTVDTIPPATFDAFRDHGKPRASLEEDVDAARETMASISRESESR